MNRYIFRSDDEGTEYGFYNITGTPIFDVYGIALFLDDADGMEFVRADESDERIEELENIVKLREESFYKEVDNSTRLGMDVVALEDKLKELEAGNQWLEDTWVSDDFLQQALDAFAELCLEEGDLYWNLYEHTVRLIAKRNETKKLK
jgi:hypothetical protein